MAKEFDLAYVEVKPNDFKICNSCGALNWYENESSHPSD